MHSIKFLELPDDMQVLIGQITEDFAPNRAAAVKNWEILDTNPEFKIIEVKTSRFPSAPITGKYRDDRGPKYAMEMLGNELPPVVIGGKSWYDGRHRVWLAKKIKKTIIEAIDLREAGLDLIDDFYMGPLK